MIIDEDDFLEHFGVQGMRWGVRGANNVPRSTRREKRAKRLQKTIERHKRVAAGKGSVREVLDASLTVPLKDIIVGKGLKGGTGRLLARQQKQKERILNGQSKAEDILMRAVGRNVRDLEFT